MNKQVPALALCTAGFAAGIAIGSGVRFGPAAAAAAVAVAVACAAAGTCRFRKPWTARFFLIAAFLACGAACADSCRRPAGNDVLWVYRLYGPRVILTGTVADRPQVRRGRRGVRTVFPLAVRAADSGPRQYACTGLVRVEAYRSLPLAYGDVVRVSGKLHRPYDFNASGKFSYSAYLRRRGVRLILSVGRDAGVRVLARGKGNPFKRAGLAAREYFLRRLQRELPGPEAGLAGAVLLGDRQGLAPGLTKLFQRTGTAHILAISGLHVGMVVAVIFWALRLFPLGRRGQVLATMFLLGCYAFLTGARAPVVRSALAAGIFLAGFVLEREPDALNSLAAAALLLLAVNPLSLFDTGFQLSFVSVLSILLFFPFFREMLTPSKAPRFAVFLGVSLSVSLAAWLGVAGLTVYYFERITLTAVLLNVAAVPLAGLTVALGLGFLTVGGLCPWLAHGFAAALVVVINAMVGLVDLAARLPGAALTPPVSTAGRVWLYYLVLAGLRVWIGRFVS